MKQLVNKNLITLKCVLFCFLAGIGCIFPFLPLHMLSVGLDKAEARLISTVAPCIALLGPILFGPLIDKLSVGRGTTGGNTGPSGSGRLLRLVTALCFIMSAVFYSLLLAVPYSERHEARRPQVYFMCDRNRAYVLQEVCTEGMRCNRWDGSKTGVLAVGYCEYGCADGNKTWLTRPFTTTTSTTTVSPFYNSIANYTTSSPEAEVTEESDDEHDEVRDRLPPQLCSGDQCLVYMRHAARMRVPLSLYTSHSNRDESSNVTHGEEEKWCEYFSGPDNYRCDVPNDYVTQDYQAENNCTAAVRCQVLDPYDEPDGVLADAECRLIIGEPETTFWTYFVIRILADIWPTASLALLGAACVIATRETSLGRGDVGRQLAWGTLGLAIFPPLAGLAVQELTEEGKPLQFLVPFIMHAVFMVMGALILLCDSRMPLSTPEWWWHTACGALAMPMSAVRRYGGECAALCAVLVLLGALSAGIDSYLPWTVMEVNGTVVELGLTLTVGALPALPALWCAESLVDYVGHSNVFIGAFVWYAVRYTGLAYSNSYAWIAVCELFEVFTMSLVWVTAILYFRHLVPRKYTVSGQALPVISHFCIGRCIGAIVGGLVGLKQDLDSIQLAYRGLAIASLVAAASYFLLYHLLLAPRCGAPSTSPPTHLLQGLTTNGASNGDYSPMRVYHEEKSRKGHFRY